MLNLFLVYKFVRRLATPFEEWKAYDLGIIDGKGQILKSRRSLTTRAEKEAFGAYDLMILNLKKALERVPGGDKKLATYAAALYLLKEWNHFTDQTMLTESVSDQHIHESSEAFIQPLLSFFSEDKPIIPHTESGVNPNKKKNAVKEEISANSASGGGIAGIGIGPDGEPGITSAQKIKYIAKNKRKKKNEKF